jgi:methionyl-tRNA formyltransferase
MSARQVFNFVRAITHPYSGAYTYLESELFRIWSVELVDQKIKGTAGRIVNVHNEGPFVVCNDVAIKVIDYSSASGKSLQSGFRLT